MAEPENQASVAPETAPPRGPVELVFNCAVDALSSALTVWFMGGVALSVTDWFAGDMIPSPPPGFADSSATNHAHGKHHSWWHALGWSPLAIFFVIFFAHSLYAGFRGQRIGIEKRAQDILAKLREDWFDLLVKNAFGAWVAVLLLGMIPNFSWSQILVQWLWQLAFPYVRNTSHFLFGASSASTVRDWIAWYDGNHMKFYFWLFFLGSVMDDLGVPNFKTLFRWGWRRMKNRRASVLPVTTNPNGGGLSPE